MADNAFQAAAKRLRSLGARGRIEFLQGNSNKTGAGAPTIDCKDGDEVRPVQLAIEGHGYTEGANLEEAVDAMAARLGEKKPEKSKK